MAQRCSRCVIFGSKAHVEHVPRPCAVDPVLLRNCFEIGFATDSSTGKEIFKVVAPVAMTIDPTMSSVLTAIDTKNNWAEPVSERHCIGSELADKAGGDVRMQSLTPAAQSPSVVDYGVLRA